MSQLQPLSHPIPLDPELDTAITLLREHISKVPQPQIGLRRGLALLDLLRLLAGRAKPGESTYDVIANAVEGCFLTKRADGQPEFVFPDALKGAICSLRDKAKAQARTKG